MPESKITLCSLQNGIGPIILSILLASASLSVPPWILIGCSAESTIVTAVKEPWASHGQLKQTKGFLELRVQCIQKDLGLSQLFMENFSLFSLSQIHNDCLTLK